jgi:hypothetical protein
MGPLCRRGSRLCPCHRASHRLRVGVAGTASVLLFSAGAFAAAPRFEVSGAVTVTDEALDVRVDVRNSGDAAATPLTVLGELFGERRQARFETGLRPGQATSAHLLFPLAVPRPGVHALPLLLEYPEGGPADAAGNPPLASQRAYLLLALGGTAEPAVRIDAPELRLDTRGELRVRLESLDGAPHRVSLRVLTARGVRADGPPLEVEVPARGTVAATVVVMRSGAPRGTRHGILLVAETLDGALERTSVATSIVEITPDPGLMPSLWRALVALALLLLARAAVLEVRRYRAAGPRAASEADPAEP